MQPVEIAAGRVQLVPFRAEDEDEVLAACQDKAIQHWTTVPSPYTREMARQWLSTDWFGIDQPTWAVREATTGALLASIAPHIVSRHRTVMVCLALVVVTTALMAATTNLAAWMAIRFVSGLASAGAFVLASFTFNISPM